MRNFEAESLHVPQGGFIASSEAFFMKLALGDDKNVVRQGPRNAMHGPKLVYPWDKHKSGPCHAQRASLGDTAKMAVGFAKSASHTVVVDDGCVKTRVSSNNLRGASTSPEKVKQHLKGDLVETFENVGPPPVRGLSWSLANSMMRAVSNHASSAPLGEQVPAKSSGKVQVLTQGAKSLSLMDMCKR